MYRTPSHMKQTDSHYQIAFGTPARSHYGVTKGHAESKDLLIQHLKREVFELKQNAKSYNELASKLSNVDHRHTLLAEEKRKGDDDFKRRDEEQTHIINHSKSELNVLRSKYNSRVHDIVELRRAFAGLQNNLVKKENEAVIIEQTLKNEMCKFETLVNSKNLVEADSQGILKESQLISEASTAVEEDLNKMNGQIKNRKKNLTDLKEKVEELDFKLKELKHDNYDREEEIQNAENMLKNKDQHLDEANHNINNLDNEVGQITKEEAKLKDETIQTTEAIKEANDFQGEMQRRSNLLLKEKQAVDLNLQDLENETNKHRMELNNIQGVKIAQENEYKHLQSIYQKMKSENSKLLDELHEFTRVDEKVKKMLSREERARDIKENAEKEMRVASQLIKEAY